MKSLDILQSVLVDAQKATSADTSRDFITIKSRHEHEGDSFLGITLATFGSWLEKSLADGRIETSIYSSFRKKAGGKSVLPCFLHGLTSLVFDENSGLLLSEPDVNAIFFIRQISYLFKKEKALCSRERLKKSFSSFEELEDSILKSLPDNPTMNHYVSLVSSILSTRLENVYDSTSDELPKHGPGVTNDKFFGNAKFTVREFYQQWRHAFSIEELYGYQPIVWKSDSFDTPRPVKVVAVPKTMKVARIIAVEPTAMQYAQQYVSKRLISCFTKTGIMNQLNLNDQTPNQRLARAGSCDGSWATLDLSEASDRLTAKLVHHIFRKAPKIRRHLFACRNPRALVGNKLLILKKFASMGSALTFPVESYCFYILAVSAIMHSYDLHGKYPRLGYLRRLQKAERLVSVFGDDIIVPSDTASLVIDYLETYGLKVNRKKSFYSGFFRESCGVDAYKGYDVTPVYIRSRIPRRITDATEVVSFVSTANQMFRKGLWSTADLLKKHVDSIYKLPLVSTKSNVLGWHTFKECREYSSYKGDHPTVTSLKVKSKTRRDRLDGYDALLKFLTSTAPSIDPKHLQQSTEKYSVKLRRSTGIP